MLILLLVTRDHPTKEHDLRILRRARFAFEGRENEEEEDARQGKEEIPHLTPLYIKKVSSGAHVVGERHRGYSATIQPRLIRGIFHDKATHHAIPDCSTIGYTTFSLCLTCVLNSFDPQFISYVGISTLSMVVLLLIMFLHVDTGELACGESPFE